MTYKNIFLRLTNKLYFFLTDPKKINKLWVAFSAYTNTRRLVTYTSVPGTLECLDGIRSFAMMWVIIGHTFVTQTQSQIMGNPADALAVSFVAKRFNKDFLFSFLFEI